MPRIAASVDSGFRDTTAPTITESEQAFVLGHIAVIGNVQLLVVGISSVVIFTIVLLAANTMAMSIRERAREIGILKALRFRRSQVLALLLGESITLSLGGGPCRRLCRLVRLCQPENGHGHHRHDPEVCRDPRDAGYLRGNGPAGRCGRGGSSCLAGRKPFRGGSPAASLTGDPLPRRASDQGLAVADCAISPNSSSVSNRFSGRDRSLTWASNAIICSWVAGILI